MDSNEGKIIFPEESGKALEKSRYLRTSTWRMRKTATSRRRRKWGCGKRIMQQSIKMGKPCFEMASGSHIVHMKQVPLHILVKAPCFQGTETHSLALGKSLWTEGATSQTHKDTGTRTGKALSPVLLSPSLRASLSRLFCSESAPLFFPSLG